MLDGKRVFPLPVAYVGDMMEQYNLQGLRGTSADFPSITLLTPKDRLDDYEGAHQHRTQDQAFQVILAHRAPCPGCVLLSILCQDQANN